GNKEPGLCPWGVGAQGEGHPGWVANSSQGTHTHTQFRDASMPTMHVFGLGEKHEAKAGIQSSTLDLGVSQIDAV
ncbi:hypothetical protein QTP86_028523, partial [Hemibagrus guttatus]